MLLVPGNWGLGIGTSIPSREFGAELGVELISTGCSAGESTEEFLGRCTTGRSVTVRSSAGISARTLRFAGLTGSLAGRSRSLGSSTGISTVISAVISAGISAGISVQLLDRTLERDLHKLPGDLLDPPAPPVPGSRDHPLPHPPGSCIHSSCPPLHPPPRRHGWPW